MDELEYSINYDAASNDSFFCGSGQQSKPIHGDTPVDSQTTESGEWIEVLHPISNGDIGAKMQNANSFRRERLVNIFNNHTNYAHPRFVSEVRFPAPVVILGDTLIVSLYLFRRQHPAPLAWRAQIQAVRRVESRLLVASGLCVASAVLGANLLNNGGGDRFGLVALGGMVATFILLLRWQAQVRDGMTSIILYLLSLALLLMTSLRGWYVTGHDIQKEYQVFQLTAAHGRWDISYLRDAYNACLSITILPTEVAQVAHVDDPYVYKFFF